MITASLLPVLLAVLAAPTVVRAGDDLELYHADFHARLGMKVYVQVGQVPEGTEMSWQTSGGAEGQGVGGGGKRTGVGPVEVITLDFRKHPAGKYRLEVELSDGRKATRTWTKPYDGVPRVGLDENNSVCVDGKLFFPIMCKGINREADIKKWKPYVNTLKHIGFDPKDYTPEGFKAWLDRAEKHGLMAIGPGRGLYWPNGGGVYKTKTQRDRAAIPEKQVPYIKIAREHPAFLMYEWKDEPELDHADNCIYPKEVRRWVEQCHELDGQHLVFCTFAGYGFARPEDNWMHKHVKSFTYLHGTLPQGKRLFADVISTDYYPIENAADKYGVSFEGMCRAMDTIRAYNADLAPLIACVETCDIMKPDQPAPTPEELRLLCWANIIHGARGISWFHYFKPTPEANFAEMKRFKEQVTRLTPAVLGPEHKGKLTVDAGEGLRVDALARTHDGHVYVFAANLKRAETRATLTVGGAEPATPVTVVDENRTLKQADGQFTDTFAPLAVHIYRLKMAP
jgi:hypothetical protein